jgi:hypothetical protein
MIAYLAATQKFERGADRVTYREPNETASDLFASSGNRAKA